MAFEATYFSFDGVPCQKYGLMLLGFGGEGQDDVAFSGRTKIIEDRRWNSYAPLHYGTEYGDPLSFKLTIGLTPDELDAGRALDRWDMQAITGWLTGHTQYKYLEIDQPDLRGVRFKCIITELKPLSHGYNFALEATVTCDSPFAYKVPEVFTLASGANTVYNPSTVNDWYFPVVSVAMTDGAGFTLTNAQDSGAACGLTSTPSFATGAFNMDGLRQRIWQTGNLSANLYQFDRGNFLRLKRGNNIITMTGNGTASLTCEFPVQVGG